MEKLAFERPIIKKLNVGMPNKFGMRSEFTPITHIDNVSVNEMI